MDPVTKERLVRELAAAIDPDSPPGMAAALLARSVVSLVQDREPIDAIKLRDEIDALAARTPRS